MCQFCVEHGEGKRWYLEASNYALDLNSDLARRDYVVDFISGFEQMRSRAVTAGNVLGKLPRPIAQLGKDAITRHQQANHFGQPLSLEDCEQVLDIASSITVIPCICRLHEPGRTAEEVCVLVTSSPVDSVLEEGFSDYDAGPDLDDFHTLSKSQAMELLRDCEDQGTAPLDLDVQDAVHGGDLQLQSGQRLHGHEAHRRLRHQGHVARRGCGRSGCREVHRLRSMRQAMPVRRHLGESGGRDDSCREVLGLRNLQIGLPAAGDSARRSSEYPGGRCALVVISTLPPVLRSDRTAPP